MTEMKERVPKSMSRRAVLSLSATFGVLIFTQLTVVACRKEERAMTMDISTWPLVHLGYHQFRTPPDFTDPELSATVGGASIVVLGGQTGSLEEVALAQEGAGQVVRRETFGDWQVFVLTEDMGLVISDYTYLALAFHRVGDRVVMTRDAISRSDFPDGNDPDRWLFHKLSKLRSVQKRDAAEGFVFDGVFFEMPYSVNTGSGLGLEFTASAVLATETGQPAEDIAGTNNYKLTFITDTADAGEDDRPLATPGDVADTPGARVDNRALKVDGADAGFSRVTLSSGGNREIWFDGSVYWPGGEQPGSTLTSAHFQFVNDAQPESDAEARALAILSSLRRNR